MALFPQLASVHLLPQAASQPLITPTLIVVHTNGGPGSVSGLWSYWYSIKSGVFSHFQIDANGTTGQYQDTSRQAPAEFAANHRAISIETQDNGDPNTPWTEAQFNSLILLISALSAAHNIPIHLVMTPDDTGIGYHQQFPAWNLNSHNCPGPVRVAQLTTMVIPAAIPTPPALPGPTTSEDKMLVITTSGKQPRIVNNEGKVSAILGSSGWHAVNQLVPDAVVIKDIDASAYNTFLSNGVFS